MTKQELRQHIRALKKQHLTGGLQRHTQTFRSETSACETCDMNLIGVLSPYEVIMLYSALPDEVPTQALIERLVGQGKTVLLPRVVSDTEMELRRYTGQQDLHKGTYGIMEPSGELFTDYDTIDVAIIPGMAFDTEGHRLGRGKGYYDRFLTRVPYIYKIGLCFSWQMVDYVPCDENDIRMDEVIQI